jgi:hypothetical protein
MQLRRMVRLSAVNEQEKLTNDASEKGSDPLSSHRNFLGHPSLDDI